MARFNLRPAAIVQNTVFAAYLLALCVVGFWLCWPYRPLEVRNAPFPILNPGQTVRQGEAVLYHSATCRHFAGVVTNTRSLEGPVSYNYAATSFYQPGEECKERTDSSAVIPLNQLPGRYRLRIESRIQVNPIRTVTLITYTDPFTVAP